MRETIPSATAASRPPTPEAPARGIVTWRLPLLIVGDALCFVIFATQGLRSHQERQGVGDVLVTAYPFALAWFLVAPFLGAYRRRAVTRGPARTLASAELAWLGAYPVALLARWALGPDHKMPLSFAVVILLANAVLLGAWRTLFAFIIQRVRRSVC